MFSFSGSSLNKFRFIAFWEGVSFLVLMFICMPLKYMMGMPIFVRIVGSLHGFLFIAYIVYAWQLHDQLKWSWKSTTWKVMLASLIPFGTFYIDKTILKEEEQKTKN